MLRSRPAREGASRRPPLVEQLGRRADGVRRFFGEFLYGFTGYEFEREAARLRGDMENVLIFMVMGDLIGVPILPPYYSLRLLPHLAPQVPAWKRRVLRERQPLDSEEYDLHGI